MRLSSVSKAFAFLASFGFARGGLFVAPLVLANVLDPSDYGALEFVQALASILAILLGLGTASVVPLVVVRKVETVSLLGVLSHQFFCALLLAFFALCAFILKLPSVFWLCALAIGALMLQLLWSATLRSEGKGEASLALDAGFWGVLSLAALGMFAFGVDQSVRWSAVEVALSMYFFVLLVWTAKGYIRLRRTGAHLLYRATLSAGVPLMVGTFLSFLATTSGRIGVGLLSTPELTAEYAVLFRATALPMVAHQIVMVSQFRQIFAMSESNLQLKLPFISGLVTFAVGVFWIFSEFIESILGSAFKDAFYAHPKVAFLILAQCILWSGIAVNETLNNRAQTAQKIIYPALLYFSLAFSLAWWFLNGLVLTLDVFVAVHSLVMVGYFLVQIVVMRRCGLRFGRAWIVTLVSFLTCSALMLFI